MQSVEGVKERLLGLVFALQKLDVVDQQNVDIAILPLKGRGAVVLNCVDEVVGELFARNVSNLEARIHLQRVVSDRVQKVGLAQARVAINKERVVCLCGGFGNGERRCVSEAVRDAGHEAVKGVLRVESGVARVGSISGWLVCRRNLCFAQALVAVFEARARGNLSCRSWQSRCRGKGVGHERRRFAKACDRRDYRRGHLDRPVNRLLDLWVDDNSKIGDIQVVGVAAKCIQDDAADAMLEDSSGEFVWRLEIDALAEHALGLHKVQKAHELGRHALICGDVGNERCPQAGHLFLLSHCAFSLHIHRERQVFHSFVGDRPPVDNFKFWLNFEASKPRARKPLR